MSIAKFKYRFLLPVAAAVSVVLLYYTAQANYLLFHSIVELSTIAIAFALFLVAWNVKDRTGNYILIYLGIAYFFIGVLDLFHTFSYKGMGIFNYDYYASELWIAARYLESISLLALFAVSSKKRPVVFEAVFGVYFIITGILLASIYYWRIFPVCHIAHSGQTAFKICSEYIICAIFAGSFVTLHNHRGHFDKKSLKLLYWSISLSIIAEFCFSLYVSVFGTMNFVGHIFKLASFYLVYRAIIVNGLSEPFEVIFRELKSKETLLDMAQTVGRIGGWKYDLTTGEVNWTDEVFRIHEVPLDYQVNFKNALNFYAEESAEKIKNVFKKLSKTAGSADLELEMITAGKHKIWVRVTFASQRDKDKTVGFYGIIQDITEYKNMERLREDMERITRHDLKSPLNSIYIAAQMLGSRKHSGEEYKKFLNIIESSVFRLVNMINLSLDVYKIEEGAYKLKTEPFDLHGLLHRLINDQAPNVDFMININRKRATKKEAFTVNGEQNLIYSMLGNLLKNAVEASPPGEKIEISLEDQDDRCVIRINNKGTVPAEFKDKFFSKYVTSGKKGGIGLGTYGAKLIAELHHGNISMESSAESGTTVTVELPHNQ